MFVGGTTTSRNLTNATLTGGELETAYSIGPFRLSADYSRVRGVNNDNGEPLATIPADTIHTAFNWSLPLGLRAQLGFTQAFAQSLVPSTESVTTTVTPSTPLDSEILARASSQPSTLPSPTPAYSLWNASLVWAPTQRWWGLREPRLVIGADNLADIRFREHLNSIASPGRSLRISLSSTF